MERKTARWEVMKQVVVRKISRILHLHKDFVRIMNRMDFNSAYYLL